LGGGGCGGGREREERGKVRGGKRGRKKGDEPLHAWLAAGGGVDVREEAGVDAGRGGEGSGGREVAHFGWWWRTRGE